nr:MAG TPA: protein of unknown function (DUF4969) [Caudoviricetes sp.]
MPCIKNSRKWQAFACWSANLCLLLSACKRSSL